MGSIQMTTKEKNAKDLKKAWEKFLKEQKRKMLNGENIELCWELLAKYGIEAQAVI